MLNPPAILVIDDEQIIRDGCQRILSKDGIRVETASDGNTGLGALNEDNFQVVLLDLKMPGVSGMEVLNRIREINPEIIVIVITGYATVESAVEAMKEGAYDFISKPFTPDQLRSVVKRALEKIALEEEAKRLRRERERNLQDIANEKSRIKTIIHCMADGVIVTDRENKIVLINPAATRIFSIDDADLNGKILSSCVKDEKLNQLIEGFFIGECSYSAISQEIMVGRDKKIFLRAHAAPVKSEEGEILGSVIVFEDITYLKELDRMKSDFVSMVSHELRTPLTAVDQQLSVILEGITGEISEKQKEILCRAKARNKELMNMIKNLLDLSQIESGKIIQYKEPIDLNGLLSKIVSLMRSQALERGIILEFEPYDPLPLIDADVNNMEGVFTNLVNNAIRYTLQGGRVTIKSGVKGEYVKVEVIDTGIGIAQEDLPKIFDKFYRVKTAQTRNIMGSGLGLSIVKGIIEAHLGLIEVESELGKGTTFTVFLPIKS